MSDATVPGRGCGGLYVGRNRAGKGLRGPVCRTKPGRAGAERARRFAGWSVVAGVVCRRFLPGQAEVIVAVVRWELLTLLQQDREVVGAIVGGDHIDQAVSIHVTDCDGKRGSPNRVVLRAAAGEGRTIAEAE